jgi:hypothetical protein
MAGLFTLKMENPLMSSNRLYNNAEGLTLNWFLRTQKPFQEWILVPPLSEDFNLCSSATVFDFAVFKGQFLTANRKDKKIKPAVMAGFTFYKASGHQ